MIVDRRIVLAGGGLALAHWPVAVLADEAPASPWSRDSHSAVRLLAGVPRWDSGEFVLTAGIEIELAKGFHTYWREPGDSGVPPVFEWSASRNLAAIDVLWPAPRRFDHASGHYIGYAESLILPLRVKPAKVNEPVSLDLKINYAVCESMCIPATGAAKLRLGASRTSSRFAWLIAAAEEKVPKRAQINEAIDGLMLGPPRLEKSAKTWIICEALVPDKADPIDLFSEGPPGFLKGKPRIETKETAPTGSRKIAITALLEGRPHVAGLHKLRFTLCAGERAIEAETMLELPGKSP